MKLYDFHRAQADLETLYGIELDTEDFEEIALIAWNKIGNKNTKLYRCSAMIDPCDRSITLPYNCDIVVAVTYNYEDWNVSSNKHEPFGDQRSQFIELYSKTFSLDDSPYGLPGKLADYEQIGNKLYFRHNHGRINVLYKSVELDEDDLPLINEKESYAIATYIAYTEKFKQGLAQNNGNIINLANTLKAEWLRACDNARTPESVSQNEMDAVLDAKTRWDRKIYNKSYKPV